MITTAILTIAASASFQEALVSLVPAPEQAVEFGKVRWERDFDAASERARKSGLPMLVLFQEVPG